MRLRLFERLRRLASWRFGSQAQGRGLRAGSRSREDVGRHRRGAAQSRFPAEGPAQLTGLSRQSSAFPQPPVALPQPSAEFFRQPADGRAHQSADGRGGVGRARIREAPLRAAPMESVAVGPETTRQAPTAVPRQPWYQVVGGPPAARQALSVARPLDAAVAEDADVSPVAPADAMRAARASRRASLPYAAPHPRGEPPTADGRRNCGALERILWRQWDAAATTPSSEVIAAIDRLAEFPRALQEKLAAGLEAIYVGAGGVPDLDDMSALHGVLLPSGRATWDACAGAYGERKIVVGSRPSPTPDVMCHEVGHALDDLDSPPGKWQSDSAEFRMIYDQCRPGIASDFHRQRGGLGRKEFFADAFAAIASAQRPALVDMLSGNTRIALRVMLYFNRRYGI